MDTLFVIVDVVCIVLLVMNIRSSTRRWLSFGYAVLGFVVPAALGALLVVILGSGFDTIGVAITLACPIAAVAGSSIPPRRAGAEA